MVRARTMALAVAVASVVSGCGYGNDDAAKDTALEILEDSESTPSNSSDLPSNDFTTTAKVKVDLGKDHTKESVEVSYDADSSTLKVVAFSREERMEAYLVKEGDSYVAYGNIDGVWSKQILTKEIFHEYLNDMNINTEDVREFIDESDEVDVELTNDYYIMAVNPPVNSIYKTAVKYTEKEDVSDFNKAKAEFTLKSDTGELSAAKYKFNSPSDEGDGTQSLVLDIKINDHADVSLTVPAEAKNAPEQGFLDEDGDDHEDN